MLVGILRALKHQMLEEVGKTCSSILFILGSDVVPQVDMNHRKFSVQVQNDLQAIRQTISFKTNFQRPLVQRSSVSKDIMSLQDSKKAKTWRRKPRPAIPKTLRGQCPLFSHFPFPFPSSLCSGLKSSSSKPSF